LVNKSFLSTKLDEETFYIKGMSFPEKQSPILPAKMPDEDINGKMDSFCTELLG